MTLETINERLETLIPELNSQLRKLHEVEVARNKIYFKALLMSLAGNAEKREAEANQMCETEGVLAPFEDTKIEVRTLLNEKECLLEISRNIRMLKGEK